MRILAAIDDSKYSEAAIQAVASRVRPQDSEVRIVHVVELAPAFQEAQLWGFVPDIGKVLDEQRKGAQALLVRAAEKVRAAGLAVSTCVCEGDPKTAILDAATEWKADLIVVGSHGRKGLDRFLLGSVSEAIARHASCSVLVVRPPKA